MRRVPVRETLKAIAAYPGDEVDLLAQLVVAIRPGRKDREARRTPALDALIELLTTDPVLCAGLALYVERLVKGRRFNRVIIDQGMPSEAFWYELRRRLTFKLLPNQPERGTIDHLLTNVFFREGDADWVRDLDTTKGIRLLGMLGGKGSDSWLLTDTPVQELLFAAKVLGLRISGKAFDSGVLRMVPEYENLHNPFVALGDALDDHIDGLRNATITRAITEESYRQLHVLIGHCRELIDKAYKNSAKVGMGFRVNQYLITMRRMLERLETTLDALGVDPAADGRERTVGLVKDLVRFNSGSTRVLDFIDHSTSVMARQVTQHTGRAGEHYITTDLKEFLRMFRTALGGGCIVAFACLFKAWMGTVDTSLVGHAALYSLNYAWAFITIYLLHFTLATKQPAMTAATIAATLDRGRNLPDEDHYDELALLLARVSRSQLVAFLGNVLMAFPVCVALAYGWNYVFGPELFAQKSAKMLHELDPFRSLAIPHAAIAGVFLFLSGLISGSVVNRTIHLRIPERIAQHPVLKLTLSQKWRERLAAGYSRHAGGVLSNFWFGVFMGSIGTIGIIFGLPLDIRHITFAAGNMGLGLVGADWQVDKWTIITSVLGIAIIGFINFIVSFGLSLSLALRSRKIPFTDVFAILGSLWERLRAEPMSFFFPPRRERHAPLPNATTGQR
ncbi:MAG: recombinase [Flavobacteriales bacterium]|nr:recombinase [Flavobacteriales bacterium]